MKSQSSEIGVQSNIWNNNSVLRQKRQSEARQNYMPFLFRSKKQFYYNKYTSPPVGSYQISSVFQPKPQVQKFSVLKTNFTKQYQMGIFKSKKQRFANNKNEIPGPTAYNSKMTNEIKQNMTKKIHKQFKSQNLIKRSPSCPAIPDSQVKYGYIKNDQGKFKLIQKSIQQIQKEKEKLKQYCSTLIGQNNYNRRNYRRNNFQCKQKKEIAQCLQKYVDRKISINNSLKQDRQIKKIKPKIQLSHQHQPITNEQPKSIGPGFYNVNLTTFKTVSKKQDFQFFGSSQMRFPQKQTNSIKNPYQNIFKEKQNMLPEKKPCGKIYKKSFINVVDPYCEIDEQLPGPGYYEPEVQHIKKRQGNTKFGFQSRFKENTYIHNDQLQNQNYQTLDYTKNSQVRNQWGNLRKEKIKSPQVLHQPVHQQQIYGILNDKNQLNRKKILKKANKTNLSPVFIDKSQRCQNLSKTITGQLNYTISDTFKETKGFHMSKLTKDTNLFVEKTPGPGSYQADKIGKKTFNLKNY